MRLGRRISSLADLPLKNVFDLKSLLTVDNLIALAILRRDPAMGQCVSYYRLTLDFRNDQGFLGKW